MGFVVTFRQHDCTCTHALGTNQPLLTTGSRWLRSIGRWDRITAFSRRGLGYSQRMDHERLVEFGIVGVGLMPVALIAIAMLMQ
jgi:hypothetical protein